MTTTARSPRRPGAAVGPSRNGIGGMRLLFVMHPVENLDASVDFFRDAGVQPIWWPDDTSAVLAAGLYSPAAVMLVNDPIESGAGCGGVFLIRDLDHYHHDHRDLDWLLEPVDRPIGRYAIFIDRTGHAVRLVDYSRNRAARTVLAPHR